MLYSHEQKSAAEALLLPNGDEKAIANARTTIGELLLQNWQALSNETQNEWHSLYMEVYDMRCETLGFDGAKQQWEADFGALTLMEGVMSGICPGALALAESWNEESSSGELVVDEILELQRLLCGK